jgi:hypothetical protein
MGIPFTQYVLSEVCETFESWDILYMPRPFQGYCTPGFSTRKQLKPFIFAVGFHERLQENDQLVLLHTTRACLFISRYTGFLQWSALILSYSQEVRNIDMA